MYCVKSTTKEYLPLIIERNYMSSWNNYGVKFTDKDAYDGAQEHVGRFIINTDDDSLVIELTDFSADGELGIGDLKHRLSGHLDNVSGVVHVSANDTSDTASGRAYDVDEGSFEMVRTQHSGDQDSRHNWPGLSYDGMRIRGGKY